MQFFLGKNRLDERFNLNEVITPENLLNFYDWRFDWYFKDGGLKKQMYYGLENCIDFFDYEQNKKLMGTGQISFTNSDFLIHTNDKVKIYYKGNIQYTGLVDSNADRKYGNIKLIPYHTLLDERLITASYSSHTIKGILQDIIENQISDVDIFWQSTLVDMPSTTLYSTIAFSYVTAKSAIEDLVRLYGERNWGVDANNFVRVYQNSSSVINKVVFNAEQKYYSKLKRNISDDKIKATRYEVFKKSTSASNTIHIGTVGNSSDYPTLSIENIKRRKDEKYTVEYNITSTQALQLAYSDLTYNSRLDQTITIEDYRIDKHNPEIGDYIKIVDDYEKILYPLNNGLGKDIIEDSTNWSTNINFSSTNFVIGTQSVKINVTTSSTYVYYSFNDIQYYPDGIEKLYFMIYTYYGTGNLYQIGLSNNTSTLFDNPYTVYIQNKNFWEMKYIIPSEKTFKYIGFRRTLNESSVSFFIDDINIYTWNRSLYEGNVAQKKVRVDKTGIKMTININDYTNNENIEFIKMSRELERLKSIQEA